MLITLAIPSMTALKTSMYVCMHVCMCMCVCGCVCACVCVWAYVCGRVYVYVGVCSSNTYSTTC